MHIYDSIVYTCIYLFIYSTILVVAHTMWRPLRLSIVNIEYYGSSCLILGTVISGGISRGTSVCKAGLWTEICILASRFIKHDRDIPSDSTQWEYDFRIFKRKLRSYRQSVTLC
jgi:hypothetical protein